MRSTSFTLQNCIDVLQKINIEHGIEKNGNISVVDLNFIITKVTKKTHPNFLKQFVSSLIDTGCVELNQNKKVITLIRTAEDFK